MDKSIKVLLQATGIIAVGIALSHFFAPEKWLNFYMIGSVGLGFLYALLRMQFDKPETNIQSLSSNDILLDRINKLSNEFNDHRIQINEKLDKKLCNCDNQMPEVK